MAADALAGAPAEGVVAAARVAARRGVMALETAAAIAAAACAGGAAATARHVVRGMDDAAWRAGNATRRTVAATPDAHLTPAGADGSAATVTATSSADAAA